MIKFLRRIGVVSAVCAAMMLSAGVAHAATSYQTARHNKGTGAVAVEVWYNSGTHNPSKGRNSFTIKDKMCNDGWTAAVMYELPWGGGYKVKGLYRECTESSFSIAGVVDPDRQFKWKACMVSTTSGALECYNTWVYDWLR